jgi:putative photosynthetic complex assembly protein
VVNRFRPKAATESILTTPPWFDDATLAKTEDETMTWLSTHTYQWARFGLASVVAPLMVVAAIHAARPPERDIAPGVVQGGAPGVAAPKPVVVQTRDLRFIPAGGTSLNVVDHTTGQQLKYATEDTASFMTTLIKGLVFDRRRRELEQGAPFRLNQWSDGRLSLIDLKTDQHIELVAFGRTNAATFASLLTQGKPTP